MSCFAWHGASIAEVAANAGPNGLMCFPYIMSAPDVRVAFARQSEWIGRLMTDGCSTAHRTGQEAGSSVRAKRRIGHSRRIAGQADRTAA